MRTNILGYPRVGNHRELKKACENYWSGSISAEGLLEEGAAIRKRNWSLQKENGIDLIPSNDFSLYDHILDMTLTVGAVPSRYEALAGNRLNLYFAMARGFQNEGQDVIAMEMTKWFDTNYHYIVPEFTKDQQFSLYYNKPLEEYKEAKRLGIKTKPVIPGPISYLLLGKEKEGGFDRLSLLERLLPVYVQILKSLENEGAEWVQMDEPFLALDIDKKTKAEYVNVYRHLRQVCRLKIMVATYFDGLNENTSLVTSLDVDALHIDLVRCPEQLGDVLAQLPAEMSLSLGIVDGRNIWKNDFTQSLEVIKKAVDVLGSERVFVAASCSFLHVPYDLDLETKEDVLTPEMKQWMAYARQKVDEVSTLRTLSDGNFSDEARLKLEANKLAIAHKKTSLLIHNREVKERSAAVTDKDTSRKSPFPVRATLQHKVLNLPLFPTTTIGSFPQTADVRSWRAKFKKGLFSAADYKHLLQAETKKAIEWQDSIGLDVLVHGEFERNDMVEYFGEQLAGFTFSQNGWVQSYGSRCVKPPIIYGDVHRPHPMTVDWAVYAQSLSSKYVKGMLTGPVTILQWSFVRNDQERSETCRQIALAIRDEVCDLEKAGIKIIQIDEPAIREGLPLRRGNWKAYLDWAVRSFCLSSSGVDDATQIHTHMCYSEFNDIIEHIARMDADVITIECSRSQMELLDAFVKFKYPNEIGPGVYDIHSPRTPSQHEIVALLKKALEVLPPERLWVNPDCGLKTRGWAETKESLIRMVDAAKLLRSEFPSL